MATKLTPTECFRRFLEYVFKEVKLMTQAEVCRRVAINKGYLNRIFKGEAKGGEETKAKIAEALGYRYEAALDLGRHLLEGKPADEWEDPFKRQPLDLQGIDPEIVQALKDDPEAQRLVKVFLAGLKARG